MSFEIKSNTTITHKNTVKKAVEWIRKDYRAVQLTDAKFTLQHYKVSQVIAVKDKRNESRLDLSK